MSLQKKVVCNHYFTTLFLNSWVAIHFWIAYTYFLVAKTCLLVVDRLTNCILFCFVGHQIPNVENHCFTVSFLNSRFYVTTKEVQPVKVFSNNFFLQIFSFEHAKIERVHKTRFVLFFTSENKSFVLELRYNDYCIASPNECDHTFKKSFFCCIITCRLYFLRTSRTF